jgi:leucyl aminopeptidase
MNTLSHIELLSDIDNPQYKNLVWEVIAEQDIYNLRTLWLSERSTEILIDNFHADKDNRKKTVILYDKIIHYGSIIVLFSSIDNLMEERSDFFRWLITDSLIHPAWEIDDAYESLILSTYHYQVYLTQKKEYRYALCVEDAYISKLQAKKSLYDAIYWSRDMINMPPKDMNPEWMIQEITQKKWNHFDVEIYDKNQLEKLGCNLLLAVGAGSVHPPYMVVLKPKNPPKTEKYALIGKGVTFDAGGIQIKPDTAMLDMKCDMSGAAWMLGVAAYLDTMTTLPVDVIIAIGITENMTWDDAFKPLDIYKAYNWTTVEIHHTDAEWRLVLADVMSYIQDTYNPHHIITMATLTWACIYALGHDIAGIMGDDEDVISTLIDNNSPFEKVWRLPMNEKLKKSLKTDNADIKNIARSEKAWSSIGAAFLSYFQWDAKLTHIDIAWPAYRETTYGYMPKGGTWWWVKVLSEFLITQASR